MQDLSVPNTILLTVIRPIVLKNPEQPKITTMLPGNTEVTLVAQDFRGATWLIATHLRPRVGLPEEHFRRLCDAGAVDVEVVTIRGEYFP